MHEPKPLDEILQAIVEMSRREVPDEDERLVWAVCFGVKLAHADPELARFIYEETVSGSPEAMAAVEHNLDQLTAMFREIIEQRLRE